VLHGLEPVLEEERGERRLEQRREHVAVADEATELVGRERVAALREGVAEPELTGDRGATLARDDVRADLGQPPLGEVREAIVERPRDGQLEDAVAEELEPLVGGGAVRSPGGMSEDVLDPLDRKPVDQPPELRGIARARSATGGK
jgi:hypothetical protein